MKEEELIKEIGYFSADIKKFACERDFVSAIRLSVGLTKFLRDERKKK